MISGNKLQSDRQLFHPGQIFNDIKTYKLTQHFVLKALKFHLQDTLLNSNKISHLNSKAGDSIYPEQSTKLQTKNIKSILSEITYINKIFYCFVLLP